MSRDELNKWIKIAETKGWKHNSGIYLWLKYDENKKVIGWYIGQSKDLANRMGTYFMLRDGKKWNAEAKKDFGKSLLSKKNTWGTSIVLFTEELDLYEEKYIKDMCYYFGVDKSYNTQCGGKNHNLLEGSIPHQRRLEKKIKQLYK